ncbi:MAG: DsbA family protein [Actinobacteria bacterium]|nr:DsbA family protein [Actinomycetota bacterium]
MHALMWFDYVCPWAYLGRDRTQLMRDLGVDVTVLPYELHPEIPKAGIAVRPGGRLSRVFDHIGAECETLGIPFVAPARSRNSRLALEAVEVVRANWPENYLALDAALASAYWVHGEDIGSWEVIAGLVDRSGGNGDDTFELVADGVGRRALDASMTAAREHGVTATPAWWVNDALLIPGAQTREAVQRWVTKLQLRADAAPNDQNEPLFEAVSVDEGPPPGHN